MTEENKVIACPGCGGSMVKNGFKQSRLAKRQVYLCKRCGTTTIDPLKLDADIVKENVYYRRTQQKFQDTNRIERKAFREHARIENALEEYSKQLIELLKKKRLSRLTKYHESPQKAAGIFHLTDTHFNELVEITVNKYDFKIASQRLQAFADNAKRFFKSYDVKNILFALTGDLLNSDRRLDELLNQATNRSKATFLAVDLLKSLILDLNKDFNVSVVSVSGNESRMADVIGNTDIMLTDNYDFMIFNALKYLFIESKGVSFIDGDPKEQVVPVAGKNVLIMHGNEKAFLSNIEKNINQLIGKYSDRDIKIDFVIFGHVHCARIADVFARGASLVGANAYSDRELQLISRASQNIHIITNAGAIHSVKIDLQDASQYEGYNFDKALEAYHPKSAEKMKEHKTVFEVVI